MTMALPRHLTVADLYAMPESEGGERYELIEGAFLANPAPTWRHQTVSTNLVRALDSHVHSAALGWVRDNLGVHVDDRTYVIPDVVFIARERRSIIGSAGIEAAPDLVCEILSPSTRRQDLLIKRGLYARIGVREYWVIDPDARSVTVLVLDAGGYTELPPAATGSITSRVLPELRLTLAGVFEDLDIVPAGEPPD